ncbi:unnamed protein product [Schistosoma mattheei]|uniref:Uncharacterized protein n=1 Tax=Schistosoma mattheei TaxID=31246 RepID=A0A183NIY6_9TREM|nr:unnamed protein product [Schistosoma mattheei]
MLDRISQLDPNVPVTFIYGSRSWMDLSSGYRTRVLLPNSYVDVKTTEFCGYGSLTYELAAVSHFLHHMKSSPNCLHQIKGTIDIKLTNLGYESQQTEGEVVLLTIKRCDGSEVFPSENQHDSDAASPQGGVGLGKVDPKNVTPHFIPRISVHGGKVSTSTELTQKLPTKRSCVTDLKQLSLGHCSRALRSI